MLIVNYFQTKNSHVFFFLHNCLQNEDVSNLVLNQGSALEDMLAEKLERQRDREDQNGLPSKILVMQPVLRFLQLLCENHNRDLQVSCK